MTTTSMSSLLSSRGGKDIRPITLSSSCAVCLSEYELGDEVVCSPNNRCLHMFHLNCILAWLSLPLRDGGSCPCCREPFAVVVVVDPPPEGGGGESGETVDGGGGWTLEEEDLRGALAIASGTEDCPVSDLPGGHPERSSTEGGNRQRISDGDYWNMSNP